MRKLIVAALMAGTLVSLPAAARTSVYVSVAPPPVPYELVPAPRPGFVWAPGFWDWRHGRYVWVGGHWYRHRPGYYYQPVRWVYQGGRYYRSGGWRDSDHDGVPNRYDRAPLNPYWH